MSVQFICRECHNAYRAGQMHGSFCPSCTRELVAKAKKAREFNESKTALADDLVRGVPSGDQREELK